MAMLARMDEIAQGRHSYGWKRMHRGRLGGDACRDEQDARGHDLHGRTVAMDEQGTDARSVFRPPRVGEYAG